MHLLWAKRHLAKRKGTAFKWYLMSGAYTNCIDSLRFIFSISRSRAVDTTEITETLFGKQCTEQELQQDNLTY